MCVLCGREPQQQRVQPSPCVPTHTLSHSSPPPPTAKKRATAEALAFGTLMMHRAARPDTPHPFLDDRSAASPLGWGLNRGHYAVRLAGQDSERGTFNQRHAVLWDQTTRERR